MAIRRLYTRQDGKWAWELVVDGNVVATDGGRGYANEADAREIVNRIVGGEFADAEKRIRRAPTTDKTQGKQSAAKQAPKASANEPAANEAQEKQSAATQAPKAASANEPLADEAQEKQPAAKQAPKAASANEPVANEAQEKQPAAKQAPKAASANEPVANEAQEKQPAARKAPAAKKSPAKKKTAQQPGSPASTSGQYQPKRGGSEVTVPKGHRLPPGPRKGEKWVNVDPTKNKSGRQAPDKNQAADKNRASGKKAAAKETSSTRNSKASSKAIPGAFTTADVREWAQRNGYAVSDRGRVPKHVSTAYRTAHQP